jgi:hypothetical protein
MTEQWDASLRRFEEINRRAQEEAQRRNDAVMADIRRRREAARIQEHRPAEHHDLQLHIRLFFVYEDPGDTQFHVQP